MQREGRNKGQKRDEETEARRDRKRSRRYDEKGDRGGRKYQSQRLQTVVGGGGEVANKESRRKKG